MDMKRWACIIVSGVLLAISSPSLNAQGRETAVSISVKGASVSSVLEQLRSRYGYSFIFNHRNVDASRNVSIEMKDVRIDEVLGALFDGTDVSWELRDNIIYISKREAVPVHESEAGAEQQQSYAVRGRVTDASGEPVIGAAVIIKGTSKGVSTGIDGSFVFSGLTQRTELEVKALGYSAYSLTVQEDTQVSIVLREDSTFLQEVVVVGYGVQRKSDLTGAISSINAEETVKKMPVNQVSDLLQGRVAGLSVVNSSGAAGATATLRVRGVNSIKADGGPLVVIDGFPGGNLSSVSPSDIKSIEILKDASSTAIYGSRGANGVILITTKTPEEDRVSVSYGGYVDVGTPFNLPEIMPAGEFARMANEWNQTYYGSNLYSERQITNFTNGYDLFDYVGTIFNDFAVSHSHDLSLRGGSKKFKFLVSGQYVHDAGIVGISSNDGWNYRMKIDADVRRNFKAGVNFSGRIIKARSNGFSGFYSILTLAQEFPQTVLPYDKDGNLTSGTISNPSTYNPIGFIDEQKRCNNSDLNFSNWLQGYLNWEPIPGLTIRQEGQISFSNRYYGTTSSLQSYQGKMKGVSGATYYDQDGFGWRMTTTANYTKEFSDFHRINATLGLEQSQSDSQFISLSADDLTSETIGWKNLMLSAESKITDQNVVRTTALSYFGRVNYVLMDRYMATVTMRRDGSSLLAYENRWDNFPSFSMAWNPKKEDFLKGVKFISDLKLRYGYGVSGNQAVAAYSAFSTYTPTIGTVGTTAYSLTVGNAALRWEKTRQHDAGLDASFLDDRITLTFDWYDKVTENAINEVVLPDDMGQPSGLRNAAEIGNRGFELTIGATPVNTSDFFWKADLTMAHNKAVINKLGDIDSDYMELGSGWGNAFYRFYEGQPIGTLYGLKSLGVWSTADYYDDNVEKPTNPVVRPGAYRYEDICHDGVINESDYTIIGNGQPKFNWGLNNTFNWRDWDLSVFFIGYHGFDIYNYPMARLTSQLAPVPLLAERWVAGINEDTAIASFGANRDAITSYENVASSTFVEKGDFVKLKSVTLGYTFPSKWMEAAGLASARAFLSAKNVFTLTAYSGNDPEMTISNPLRPGLDAGIYPAKREFIFGVNVSF